MEYNMAGYKALAMAIIEQAAKDRAKTFFCNTNSILELCLPNIDGKSLYRQIEKNYNEYGSYCIPDR